MSDVLGLVARCYEEGQEKRRKDLSIPSPFPPFEEIEHPWRVFDDLYHGDHWSNNLISAMASWKSRPVVNYAFRGVESYTTFLTDNRPAIKVLPVEPGDEERSRVIQAGVMRWWDIQDADTKVTFAVRDSRKFGVGWLRLSELELSCINPEHVYVDPDTACESYDPTWLLFEYKADVGALMKRYKDLDLDSFDPDWEPTHSRESGYETDRRFQPDTKRKTNVTCKVYELWVKDDSEVVWDEELERLKVRKAKKKYPKGRVIVAAGGQVLEDRENPYDHGEFPFIPVFAYGDTTRAYPAGDIENIFGLQIMYNRMLQLLFDQTVMNAGGIYLCNPNLGVSKENIKAHPSYALDCQDVQRALNVIRPYPPSRHVFDFLYALEKAMNDVLGLHDISYGAYTPGNKTAEEVATLAESDMTRVRAAARMLESSIKRLGRQLLHNLRQFGKEDWVVEVAGDYEGTHVFNPSLITDKVLERDLTVAADSMLPLRQQEKVQQAFQLAQMGYIDGEELLRVMRWPNYKEVWRRSPAAKAQQQQEQQERQQLAGGGAPTVSAPAPPDATDPLMEVAQATGMAPEEILAFLAERGVDLSAVQ